MADHYVPKLRQRFLEDMRIKGLQPKTQTMYLRAMRDFTQFLWHAPDSATPEELRAFQLDIKERGVGAPTFNNRLTVLSFFYASSGAHRHGRTPHDTPITPGSSLRGRRTSQCDHLVKTKPQQACHGKRGDQSANSGRGNQHSCTVWRHAIGRPAHQTLRP